MSGFSYLVGQTPGTGTNDNAAAGCVGEILTASLASGSATSVSSGVSINITAGILLTPGDWDVTAVAYSVPAATTGLVSFYASISSTTGTLDQTVGRYAILANAAAGVVYGGNPVSVVCPVTRFSVSSNTQVYLVVNQTFGISTSSAHGFIRARRVR